MKYPALLLSLLLPFAAPALAAPPAPSPALAQILQTAQKYDALIRPRPELAFDLGPPIPLILVDDRFKNIQLKPHGRLADIAPTLLKMLNLPNPQK